MRHNPYLITAVLAALLLLTAAALRDSLRQRLWRRGGFWIALAVTAVILYGVTCPYGRVRMVSISLQVHAGHLKRALSRTLTNHGLPPLTATSPLNPERYLPRNLHKTGHVLLFALLSALLLPLALPREPGARTPGRTARRVAALLLGLVAFGGILELLQLITPEREPKLRDFLFDLKGIGIGLGTASLLLACGRLRAAWRRRRPPVVPLSSAAPVLHSSSSSAEKPSP